jgi:putative ABC transport system permease protein
VYAPLESDPAPDGRAVVIVKASTSAKASADKSAFAKADNNLAAATHALREEVRALDPNLPLFGIETLDTAIARSRMPVRMVGTWFAVLALVALVLASVGLYALTAHGVAQRVQEIGVRVALGAQAPQVVWLFLRRTLVQLAIGLTLGLVGALSVGRLLGSFLRDTSPRDPITVAMVTLLLVVVAAAATLFPARRAARVDPMVALRTE